MRMRNFFLIKFFSAEKIRATLKQFHSKILSKKFHTVHKDKQSTRNNVSYN